MPARHSVEPRPTVSFSCLPRLVEHQAKRNPDAPAILAPGRAPLSFGCLFQHIDQMGRTLRAMGIGRRQRMAVVLPNGPEMAVAVLSVAASAMCAPVNSAYGAEELDRYFADLRPHALLTAAEFDSPARRVALSRGIRVVELLSVFDTEAGLFTLTGDHGGASPHEPVSPSDVALLLLTSGTTSRAKIVPLTHANLCASAHSSGVALALKETDRSLNVLPLFHGHGLIATVLASLAAGASVVCTPGCDVNSFFEWLTVFRPTWYSAVPTMHQAILAQARHHREQAPCYRLRFVRSASAPLPPRIHGAGADFRGPADRVLRHDRNRFRTDRVQSAAAAPAQAGFGRLASEFGGRDHRRKWSFAVPRSDGAGHRSWRERHARLRRLDGKQSCLCR